jgi:hypothetical protein
MADNVTPPGLPKPVATDEIGGVDFQRVKLTLGADGVNDGDVSAANPIPVEAQAMLVLQRIASLLKPLGQVTGAGSNRLSVDINSGGTITTVTTVTSVSNVAASTLTNVANVWAFDQAKAQSRTAYNTGIRGKL